ncbi:MAG: Hsp20/alpha crystallin family protein, partial [Candidatus Dojkabacteria bacterium]
LEGKLKEETENKDEGYLMQEYREGSFKRMITLPGEVDHEKIEAELVDGVLKLTLPKLPEVMPKRIEIK